MLNDRECKINTFFKLRLRKGNDALMFPFNMVIITSTKKKKKKNGSNINFQKHIGATFLQFRLFCKMAELSRQSVVKNIRILLVKFDKLSKQTITISFREI